MPATDYGVSFRATSGYVTDPTNVTYNLAEAYPVTRGGVTHGWQSGGAGIAAVNRSTGVDARLAGINYTPANTTCRFQMDLQETGLHDVRVAVGDQNGVHNYSASIYDDTTLLFTICTNASISAGSFKDAGGTTHTAANWPGSNVAKSLTFSTTKLVIELTALSGQNVCLAHVYAVYTGSSTTDGVGAASGTGAATGVGQATAASAAASTGTGAASGVGRSSAESPGAASATSTAAGVGQSSAASPGSVAGAAEALGVGQSTTAAVGAAAGGSQALAAGEAVANSAGLAEGTSSAAGISPGVTLGTGEVSAAAQGVGVGSSLVRSVGSVGALGSALGVGFTNAYSDGSSSAVSQVTAAAISTATAVAVAAGVASVVGASDAPPPPSTGRVRNLLLLGVG